MLSAWLSSISVAPLRDWFDVYLDPFQMFWLGARGCEEHKNNITQVIEDCLYGFVVNRLEIASHIESSKFRSHHKAGTFACNV